MSNRCLDYPGSRCELERCGYAGGVGACKPPLTSGEQHFADGRKGELDRRAANNDGDGKGKVSNPKDAIADTRIPLWLLSPVAKIAWALAQFAGLLKYGAWNWRVAGVRASVYISAIERHIDAYKSGEKYDPVDGTDHRGNIMACCALLIEAEAAGKLEDDRPPVLSHRATIAEGEALMARLKAQYVDCKPRHWTIADTEKTDGKT